VRRTCHIEVHGARAEWRRGSAATAHNAARKWVALS
jgi:hypothetical protein